MNQPQPKRPIYLIHVARGLDARSGARLGFFDFIRTDASGKTQAYLPTSDEPGMVGPLAIAVEQLTGQPPCVYFYAFRACPHYGEIALVFDAEFVASLCQGGSSTTPFDSGALFNQNPQINFECTFDRSNRKLVDLFLINLFNCHKKPLSKIGTNFWSHILIHFKEPEDYFRGSPHKAFKNAQGPTKPGPAEIYLRNLDSFTVYAFEARCDAPVPIPYARRIFLHENHHKAATRDVKGLLMLQFLEANIPPFALSIFPVAEAEHFAAREAGIIR